jgi:hypothetical protein
MIITALFALSWMLVFMLAVLVTDTRRAYRVLLRGIHESFGHDTNIFLDHIL